MHIGRAVKILSSPPVRQRLPTPRSRIPTGEVIGSRSGPSCGRLFARPARTVQLGVKLIW